jgi:ribonuclease D
LVNPYLPELEVCQINNDFYCEKEPIQPVKINEAQYEYIDTVEALINLKTELSIANRDQIKEIAIDLEHHNHRSYLGFTCLMQISTRYKDYIIDTIKLRNKINILNEIFTDSTLLKVFHGSDSDIEWLQKDFGIYVINMFDTGQASRLLQYPHFSLSYLLRKFCNVQAQKQYQMSDWRQRPLSDELISYAREDTHYLLYIYDNLRNDLIKTNQQLKLCFDKSKILCKKVYKKPIFYSKNYQNLCAHNEHLNARQIKALELLYQWRDCISRENDESCDYVLKNHQLLKIAELLPREIYGILALCNPVSHIVEANLHQIHEIITKAREYKIENQLEVVDNDKQHQQQSAVNTFIHLPLYDPDNILNCPHDSAHFNARNEDIDVDVVSSISKFSDLLIKPNKIELNIPNDIIFSIDKASLFVDNVKQGLLTNNNKDNRVKRKLKVKSRIDLIINSMKNPFEKYLPNDLRRQDIDEDEKWTLLQKTKIELVNKPVDLNEFVQAKVEDLPDNNLIPLKLQLKQQQKEKEGESNTLNPIKTTKKMKKLIKELELNNAIEARNRRREQESAALGGVNRNNNNNEYVMDESASSAICSNLALIAANVRGNNNSNEEATEFSYDNQNFNEMFNKNKYKNQKNVYDPSSKLNNVKFGRVGKKRNFNQAASVSRSKNNQSATFKK